MGKLENLEGPYASASRICTSSNGLKNYTVEKAINFFCLSAFVFVHLEGRIEIIQAVAAERFPCPCTGWLLS